MQYEDEKVSDMCGYVIKNLYGLQSIEGLGSGRAIEVVLRMSVPNNITKNNLRKDLD